MERALAAKRIIMKLLSATKHVPTASSTWPREKTSYTLQAEDNNGLTRIVEITKKTYEAFKLMAKGHDVEVVNHSTPTSHNYIVILPF
jgi:hypothetical protein